MDIVQAQKQIKKSVENTKMNANLEDERKNCAINVFELASFLHSNTDSLDQFLITQKTFEEDPILKFKPEDIGVSSERAHTLIAQRNVRLSQILKRESNSWTENYMNCIVDCPVSSSIHGSVCIPYLKLLASDDQLDVILPKAEAFQIQICYCSAELAHGSDINSVQTEAHYEEQTDEFVINTPTLGATKWWIGDYGKLATHAIIFAKLYVNQQKQGVAAFLIPIRNASQPQLLPGIEVGDIETKQQGGVNDNGFVRFKQFRVAKESLLQRYTQINKGQVQLSENKKVLLANMIQKRVGHILELGLHLAQASTIAVRFSLVQDRYYNDQFGTKIIKNLDYQAIQQKILPQLSQSYMILLSWFELKTLSQMNVFLCKKGDFSLSSEVKAISNGLKALSSRLAYFGVETLRQSTGNVGLSQYAGFNQILQKISAFPLYEADSTSLQEYTAKYLQKKLKDKNDQSVFTRFLNTQRVQQKCILLSEHEFEDLTNLLFILEQRAQFLALSLSKKIEEQNIANKKNQTSLQSTENATAELSDSFTDTVLLRSFIKRTQKVHHGQFDILSSFKSMGIIYALGRIISTISDYIQYEYISVKQLKIINAVYKKHLLLIRKNAIGLVDSFSFSDNSLKSAIGVFSGHAYETLNDWVQNKNSLNSEDSKRIHSNAVLEAREELSKQQQPKL